MPILNLSGRRPNTLGVQDGRLAAAPSKPNCASSYETEGYAKIEPIQWAKSAEEAVQALVSAVQSMAGAKIIEQTGDYLYAEFTTPTLGFVDDVEFYIPADKGLIHMRSASRLGYSDWGVNRKRLEEIRAKIDV